MEENLLNKLIITKIYSVNKFFNSEKSGNRRKNRSSWAIIFKFEGETKYTTKTQTIVSNSKNLVILPHGISYFWECEQAGQFYSIEFEANMDYNKIISCHYEDTDTLINILEEILNAKKNLDPFSSIKSIQLIYKILYLLLKNNIEPKEKQENKRIILPAIKYINENLNKKIDNDILAKLCYISTSYFRKIFTSVFNVSPAHYVTDLRIQQAKELLRSDFVSISKIAEQVGYDDVYHFSKVFKMKTGYSPLNYLKKKLKDPKTS